MLTIRTTEKGIYVSVDGKQEMAHPLGSLRYTCTSTSVRFFPANGYEGLYEGRYGDNFTVNGEPVTKENAQTLLEALFFLKFDPSTKQDTLVSGENIKTVNGIDVLGNGNIVINPTIMDLKWTTNVATTRKLVPAELRSKGVKIAYRDNNSVYHVEQYQVDAVDDASWENDVNWKGCRTPLTPLFEAAGIAFNDVSGFYEYNELTDITEYQAAKIYCMSGISTGQKGRLVKGARTLLAPPFIGHDMQEAYSSTDVLETIEPAVDSGPYNGIKNAFSNNPKLRKVIGEQKLLSGGFTILNAPKLEYIKVKFIGADCSIKSSPLINYESVRYWVDNANNTKEITITVHPTTYGYLTGTIEPTPEVGGTKEEWMQIVTDATEKQITFATAE